MTWRLVQEVENPRPYGIIEGDEVGEGVYRVKRVVEKPEEPKSNLAITAVYLFAPMVFEALKSTPLDRMGELQLTDGIQQLIDRGFNVSAVKLGRNELWLDVGNPQSYWTALRTSHDFLVRENKSR